MPVLDTGIHANNPLTLTLNPHPDPLPLKKGERGPTVDPSPP